MSDQIYFIIEESKQIGPLSLEEMIKRPINRETLMWREGLKEWTKAKNLAELEAIVEKLPPPFNSSENDVPFLKVRGVPFFNKNYQESDQLKAARQKLFTIFSNGLWIVIKFYLLFGLIGFVLGLITTTFEEAIELGVAMPILVGFISLGYKALANSANVTVKYRGTVMAKPSDLKGINPIIQNTILFPLVLFLYCKLIIKDLLKR